MANIPNNEQFTFTDSSKTGFMQIRYTDLLGKFLAKYIQLDTDLIQDIFRKGIGLDGSSVRGFATIDESDMMLFPDRKTLRNIPLSDYMILSVIADVYNGFSQGRSNRDPRHVSQSLEDHLAVNQISCQIGAEVECFIFDQILFNTGNSKDLNNNLSSEADFNNVSILSTEQYGIGKYPIKKIWI